MERESRRMLKKCVDWAIVFSTPVSMVSPSLIKFSLGLGTSKHREKMVI